MGVRVFTGRDAAGRPTRVSRTVQGTKKDAQRVAAELTLKPSNAAGRTVTELLEAWLELNEASWAPATVRDERSTHPLPSIGGPQAGPSSSTTSPRRPIAGQ